MIAVIVFGVVLLVCAVEVIRLAKDARADMDSDRSDVFARRWRAVRGLARLVGARPATRRSMSNPTVQIAKRDMPTEPSLTRG